MEEEVRKKGKRYFCGQPVVQRAKGKKNVPKGGG